MSLAEEVYRRREAGGRSRKAGTHEPGLTLSGDATTAPPPRLFECSICDFSSNYDVLGRTIKECSDSIVFMEDSFLLRDPFSGGCRVVCLGSFCRICGEQVCASQTCSLFYVHRFCGKCALENVKAFPDQLQRRFASFAVPK